VVPNVSRPRGREGIELTARSAVVFTFRDGRVIRVCLYQDRQEALKAVGLAEQPLRFRRGDLQRVGIVGTGHQSGQDWAEH
jgi:hypothetical protein